MSRKLDSIFKKKDTVPFFDEVSPVKIRDYDEFMEISNIITINYQHFQQLFHESIDGIKLLDLLYFKGCNDEDENTFKQLAKVFSIVGQEEFTYTLSNDSIAFHNNDNENLRVIDSDNYDEIRAIIMKQNLMFEPPVFKSKIKQQWAEMVLAARAKNSIDMDIEDYITTLCIVMGKDPEDFLDYSIYQIHALFARLGKFKVHEMNLAMIGHTDKIGKEHYAEKTDLHKSPYDDLFVDSNKKVGKLSDSM